MTEEGKGFESTFRMVSFHCSEKGLFHYSIQRFYLERKFVGNEHTFLMIRDGADEHDHVFVFF